MNIKNSLLALTLDVTFLPGFVPRTQAQQTPPIMVVPQGAAAYDLPFDPLALTNAAGLASLCERNVDHVMVGFYDQADASIKPGMQWFVFPFTNTVKSWDALMGVVNNTSFAMSTFDPTKYVSAEVYFTKGDPSGDINGTKDGGFQTLLYGGNGGYLITNQWGMLTLDTNSSKIQMSVNYAARMYLPGLIAGKAVVEGPYGYSYANDLNVNNGEFTVTDDMIGQSTFVLFGYFGGQYQTIAFSLVTGQQVPIKDAWIQLLVSGSQAIIPFTDATNVNVQVQTWNINDVEYGVNPLIIVHNVTSQKGGIPALPVTLTTSMGTMPKGYTVLNIANGATQYVPVPTGATNVMINLDLGEYHLIPDLRIKNANSGGKG